MSNAAADDVVEEVWTPKAAAAAKQEARQPKSGKFAALASGIPILGAKSDDNLQPCPPPLHHIFVILAHCHAHCRYVTTPPNGEDAPVDWGQVCNISA
jgi:hypothetical protein